MHLSVLAEWVLFWSISCCYDTVYWPKQHKGEFILALSSGVKSIMVGNVLQKRHELAAHVVSMYKKQREIK